MALSFNGSGNLPGMGTKRQKFGIGSLIITLLIGIVFSAVGVLGFQGSQIDPSWVETEGRVTDVSSRIRDGSTEYTPVYAYTVDGVEYQIGSNTSSSFRPIVGSTGGIVYNPSNPAEAKTASSTGQTLLFLIFPVVGVALVVYAISAFLKSLKRSSQIGGLQQSGQKIQGVITDIQSTGGSNNQSYKIVVSAVDSTGTARTYMSDGLTGIGGLAMADFRTNPIPIDVIIDPSDQSNYYVDVSGVPSITPQRIQELIQSARAQNTPQSIVGNPIPGQGTPMNPIPQQQSTQQFTPQNQQPSPPIDPTNTGQQPPAQ